MTDLTIKLCSTLMFHSNFLWEDSLLILGGFFLTLGGLKFNITEVLLSGLVCFSLGCCECKLSSHTKDQSWTNQKKKIIGRCNDHHYKKEKSISEKLGRLN